jgi:hypothetical protein
VSHRTWGFESPLSHVYAETECSHLSRVSPTGRKATRSKGKSTSMNVGTVLAVALAAAILVGMAVWTGLFP